MTKLWAERTLADAPIEVIRGALTLRFTTNSGGAFSLGQSAPWLFAGATIVVSLVIVATAFRHRDPVVAASRSAWSSEARSGTSPTGRSGARGSRVRSIDFIDPHIWPVFNVADAAIVIGALLLAWSSVPVGEPGRGGRRRAMTVDAD